MATQQGSFTCKYTEPISRENKEHFQHAKVILWMNLAGDHELPVEV
jgi:hypothetical protein